MPPKKCRNSCVPSLNHLAKRKKAKKLENHTCVVCSKSFTNRYTFSMHMFYHTNERPFKCSTCGKAFKIVKHLKLHKNSVHRTNNGKVYDCANCPRKFLSSGGLKQHENKLHGGFAKVFKCDICEKTLYSPSRLSNHKLTHTKIKNFSCLFCDHRSRSLANLMSHLQCKHIGEKPYDCTECPAAYSSSSSLKTHIQYTHRLEEWDKNKCSLCNKKFSTKHLLNRHLKFHTGEKPFTCSVCDMSFVLKWMLNKHVISHEQVFSCEVCRKIFASAENLKKHQLLHSARVKLKCAECPATYVTKAGLQFHVQEVHKKERPFPCSLCGKSFSRRWLRDNHLASHLNEMPHECQICGKRLKLKSSLFYHMNLHGSKVEFPCVSCPKRFLSRTELLAHQLKVHIGSNEDLLTCVFCSKKVGGIRSLEVHIQLHTREQPYFCNVCDCTFSTKVLLRNHQRRSHGSIC